MTDLDRSPRLALAGALLAAALAAPGALLAQAPPPAGAAGAELPGTIPTPRPAAPTPASIVSRTPSPYLGSVPSGTATAEEIPLSLSDAIARGLSSNLGAIDADLDVRTAESEQQRALSSLLPQLAGRIHHQTGEVSLIQFGFQLPGIPTIIGPFSYQDARIGLTEQLFNYQDIESYRAAREAARAASLTRDDSRDTVVLAVGAAYFQVVSSQARVTTSEAQQKASRSLADLATSQVQNGLSPAIDSLRAQVQAQTDEQRLAVARAQLEKDKLSLARLIGLPAGQRFRITTEVAYQPWTGPAAEDALKAAYQSRNDLKSATAALHAAELARRAAGAERIPALGFNADYGRIGKNLGRTDSTFTVAADLTVPLFTGGRTAAAEARAQALLDRRKAELADLTSRVDYEVRSAFFDLQAAQTSVEVAKRNIDLAEQAFAQSEDRFKNGVTGNVEVVLAAQAVAAANENYIASLFSHNFSKLALLKAMGVAEQGVRQYLDTNTGGK
jgi:outer membrane protein TolC